MSEALVIEAVRKTITVDCVVEEAFRVFTAEAETWWPRIGHSLYENEGSEIVFEGREGGEVYELSRNGEKGHWATVVSWEPPNRLVLAWNVRERGPVATEVEVRFLPEGGTTRVELEHRGWEALGEGAAERRSSYDTGWGQVLGGYLEWFRRPAGAGLEADIEGFRGRPFQTEPADERWEVARGEECL